ncbi:unnamed protein product [Closterium sp. NIES-65]|nr:unnamed protein product [Closterium sp. NIES-65]
MGLLNQELLGQSDTWKRVLFQLPDRELQDRMDATWRSDSRRASAAADVNLYRWQQLEATTRAAAKKVSTTLPPSVITFAKKVSTTLPPSVITFAKKVSTTLPPSVITFAKKNVTLRKAVEEIVFAFTYPRLDLESTQKLATPDFSTPLSLYVFVSVPLCLCATLSLCHSVSVPLCLCATLSLCHSVSVPLCLSVSLPLCLSVSLFLCLSVSLPLCLSVSLSLRLSVSLSLCLSVSVPLCLSVSLSLCLSASLSLCLSVSVPLCLSVSLSLCLSVSLCSSQVSKHMNHLLKAPFCVHPKTGAVCVPIDPANCADFEPSQAPTLNQQVDGIDAAHGASDLMNEINAAHRESDGAAAAPTGRPPCLNSPSLSSTVLPRPSLPSQLMNEINAAHRGPDGAAAAAMGKGSLPLFLLLTFLTSTLISVLRFVPCRYSGAFDVQYVDF